MKKKVLYGAALALFASVSMGTLQSCKDDLSDLAHQNAYDHKGFNDQINGLRTDVDALKTALDQCKANCGTEIAALKASITDLQQQINANKADADATKALTQQLEQQLRTLSDKVNLMYTNDQIDEMLGNLKTLINAYLNDSNAYTDEEIKKLQGILESKITTEVTKLNALITDLDTKFGIQLSGFQDQLEEIVKNQDALVGRVTELEANYETQMGAIKAAQNEIDELWKNSQEQSDLISQVYQALKDDLDEMGLEYAKLSNEVDELYASIFGDGGLRDQISQTANALRDEFTAVDEELWNAIFERDETLTQAMNALRLEFAEADEELWNALNERDILMTQYYEALRNEFTEADEEIYKTIEAVREEATMFWNATNASLDELRNEDEQIWLAITGPGGLQEQISQVLNVHAADIADLQSQIDELNTKYDNLLGRMDNLVTGILIQSTDNPVFGNFSLPIGVKNNMLFNWYGYNSSLIKKFPSNSNAYAYNDQLAGVDFNAIGAPVESVQQGFMGDVNLGRVYLTVNPVGHNFDNTKFTLETSAGKALPFGLKVSKSDDELFFGYTRADNGFYAADVIISGEQADLSKGVDATKLTVDDELKAAVKDVLKDRTKRNALELLKAVYGQLSNQLPAYAVRYDWTDAEGKPYAVLSNYDLAVASAKPLSYQFFYNQSIDHKLPTIGHIDNIINELKGQFKIDFTPISFDDIEINLPPIDLSTVDVKPGQTVVSTVLDPIKIVVDGEDHYSDPIPVEIDINDVVGSITEQFNDAINDMTSEIKNWSKDANEKISADLQSQLKPIADQINGMVEDINGQIDNIIGDMANKAQPWFDRLNKLVDLYNKVAGKINNVLDDPNHLLQVAMFYQGGKAGMNILSNSKTSPTVFNSGKGYVGLYASSYSAEIVAPAYKKYVAVSNVYEKKNGKVVVADNAKALMDKVNGKNHFNEVMDGNTIRYSIPAENLQKGLIYEIVYQGLDFHGVTSTQKFYITVK